MERTSARGSLRQKITSQGAAQVRIFGSEVVLRLKVVAASRIRKVLLRRCGRYGVSPRAGRLRTCLVAGALVVDLVERHVILRCAAQPVAAAVFAEFRAACALRAQYATRFVRIGAGSDRSDSGNCEICRATVPAMPAMPIAANGPAVGSLIHGVDSCDIHIVWKLSSKVQLMPAALSFRHA